MREKLFFMLEHKNKLKIKCKVMEIIPQLTSFDEN